jgi:hypothetical protein
MSSMVSCQDTEWKVFLRFMAPMRSTLLFGRAYLGSYMAAKTTKKGSETASEGQHSSARSARLGKRLDNVVIPALVREYMVEIKERNRLATTGGSEVTSD